MATFAERLRELRKERKMTQTDLANVLGVAMNTESIWERGERQPDDKLFISIAEYFGVPLTYLAGESDKREWSELSDQEAAEVAAEEEKEIDAHLMELLQDLSPEMEHMVRAMVAEAYRFDRSRGKLKSQQLE